QRSAIRMKEVDCFKNVAGSIFVVSMSEYDQMLYKDESNRMQEALTLFDLICNSRWFVEMSIVSFPLLSCRNIWRNITSYLGDYFLDYDGGNNFNAACVYLLHQFVSLNQSAATKQIYPHYACATDIQQSNVCHR
ncbi:G-alpha-domain-containing protein, partial [Gymnopus androsaceus JB14]